jgi:ABC-type multidrug transport system fused ATPase/permease subunit
MRWPLQTEIRLARTAFGLLEPGERRRVFLLVPPTLLVALLEVAGVASLAPFIALLAEPERFMKHRVLRWVYTTLGFRSFDSLFFAVGVGILILLIISNVTAATTTWAMFRFSWLRSASMSTRLLRGYLHRPYPFFLERNAADLLRKSLTDVQSVALDVMLQLMALVARLFVILLIGGALFVIEPVLAAGAVVVFGGMYGALFTLSRRWATKLGKTRMEADARRFKVALEGLHGAKEIKLYRLEDSLAERYRKASVEAAKSASNNIVLSQVPRYALETLAFGGVLILMLYLLKTRGRLTGALPILGLYAFASMRLLPALQAVFTALNSLRFHSTVVGVLEKEFASIRTNKKEPATPPPLAFDQKLELDEVTFSYANTEKPVLSNVSVSLKPGEWVGFVGPTGSGKSTLVDIMLGLLEPTTGRVLIDGVPLTPDLHRSWQARTAYVPQLIFLVADTVEANICFGIPPEKIDRGRMEMAARIAQIHDFIVSDLPNGYQTQVGDRGVRISGGQRQRVGIARALYRSPRFLVLDEATSALDSATEAAFFQTLRAELHDVTVVSITHRLTTTKSFDRVYQLEGGVIVAETRPDALIERAEPARV